ncbi:MAG TPA: type II toxin-antitoxin system VapC family toxin [Pyrinomonadaceae bacterium]|nr:type II toxin-antitoxin system VapC family toxin [Pyrinomonadaceae bacterium]
MRYLLDTCAVSEPTKKVPNTNFLSWFESRDEARLYISVITSGEIENGIYRMPKSKKRASLETWLNDQVLFGFLGRVLEITQTTMSAWASLSADLSKKGIVRPSFDSLIEATALEHDMVLVTRNVKNFQGSPVTILNPWEPAN